MRKPISEIVKKLDLKPHQLHTWETNGWLGDEPVLKDPEMNNQRVYSEEQLERIEFLKDVFDEQREKGVKRVPPKLVEDKLLERFGGLKEIEKREIAVLPSSLEEFQNYLMQQNNVVLELKEMVQDLQQREPEEPGMTKEQADELLDRLKNEEKRREESEKEMKLLKEKLDVAVDYIQSEEEKSEKRGFWKRIFG